MNKSQHAILFIDHQGARVLQFDAEHVQAQKLEASSRHTRHHGAQVRTEHEFYSHGCEALEGIAEVLAVGPHTGLVDFQHYVRKHRPETARRIVDYQTVDHPSENQLVALARQFFLKHDRMAGVPTPS